MSSLKEYLEYKFRSWKPLAPRAVSTSKSHVELCWSQDTELFGFLGDLLLYRVQRKEKLPPWVMTYSGGKTCKLLDNLAPSQPHKFRVQVILRDVGVPLLAFRALEHFGSQQNVLQAFDEDAAQKTCGEDMIMNDGVKKRWLESLWSEEVWSNTESVGASAVCFCMAVRCGYLAQVQSMIEERPELVNITNSTSGLTPLATAVMRGNAAMVRALLSAGADVNTPVGCGTTVLHLSLLHSPALTTLLLENGGSLEVRWFKKSEGKSRDVNGCRAEHYLADGGRPGLLQNLKGADLTVTDSNGWTPLFRAVVQGASVELISELAQATTAVPERDRAGLTLRDVALVLRNERGERRGSVLRAIDPQYGRAKDNYNRVRQKVARLHSLVPSNH